MRAVALLVLLALLASGCSGGAGAPAGGAQERARVALGNLEGVVVSTAVVPLPEANVTLQPGGATTMTGSDGSFAFEGLEPGTYTLTVALAGYVAVTLAAQTGGGLVKVVLEPDTTGQRYVVVQAFEGFIQWSGNLAGTRTSNGDPPNYTFEGRLPDFIHVEMTWESTQALGDEMDLTLGANAGGATVPVVARSEGTSPLVATINATAIAQAGFGPNVFLDLFIFVGQSDVADGRGVGAALNQRYQLSTLFFYGFEPPEGYQFSRDGQPRVPP